MAALGVLIVDDNWLFLEAARDRLEREGLRVVVEAADDTLRYCVEKGSITVDGVSLTIAALHEDAFEIALIPHTLEETTLATIVPGQRLNLEVDVLAKYVERLLSARSPQS